MDDVLEIRIIDSNEVYFRKKGIEKEESSQPKELERIIKELTDEDFEDYIDDNDKVSRRLVDNDNFKIISKYSDSPDDSYTCLCSENTCRSLFVIKHIPTSIYMALGSVCYKRFNPENEADIYYHSKAKKCNCCKSPLVFKEAKFKKNTDKTCNGECYECIDDKLKKKREIVKKAYMEQSKVFIKPDESLRIYLNVKFEDKDDAKALGAWWCVDKKKWYTPNNNDKYYNLIQKYS